MIKYTTPAEDAANIRAQYKALGWSQKMISVRAKSFSMGSSITVEIKSAEVDRDEAEKIAVNVAERIDRDWYGDILNGGNRYVHVNVEREVRDEIGLRYLPQLEKALAELEGLPKDHHAEVVPGITIARQNAFWTRFWTDRAEIEFDHRSPEGRLAGGYDVYRLLAKLKQRAA